MRQDRKHIEEVKRKVSTNWHLAQIKISRTSALLANELHIWFDFDFDLDFDCHLLLLLLSSPRHRIRLERIWIFNSSHMNVSINVCHLNAWSCSFPPKNCVYGCRLSSCRFINGTEYNLKSSFFFRSFLSTQFLFRLLSRLFVTVYSEGEKGKKSSLLNANND